MNRNLAIIGVVVVLLLGFGAYLFLQNQNKTAPQATQVESQEEAPAGTLRSLLGLRSSQVCTYSAEEGIEGKVYVTEKKMRGDFTTGTDNKTSHVIIDGENMFAWSDGEKEGFKMSFNLDDIEADASAAAQSNVDLDAELNFKCASWTVDNDLLVPPSNVTFRAFTAPSLPAAANCSVCNNLSGQAKDQCLKALSC